MSSPSSTERVPWSATGALVCLAFTALMPFGGARAMQTNGPGQTVSAYLAGIKQAARKPNDWPAKIFAAQGLASLGSSALSAVPDLSSLLSDRVPQVRQASANAIGQICANFKGDDSAGRDAVVSLLGRANDRPEVRDASAAAILRIGPRATPVLISMLRTEPDDQLRQFSAELLNATPQIPLSLAKDLAAFFKDKISAVRSNAAGAATRSVEGCIDDPANCAKLLPTIRGIEAALAAVPDLHANANSVKATVYYVELVAANAEGGWIVSFFRSQGLNAAILSFLTFVALIVTAVSAVNYKRAYHREKREKIALDEKIAEISSVSVAVEKNAIARSVLKRFVTMPQSDERPAFTIDSAFASASDVSGDFYNWFNRTDGSTCVYLVDVEGSGIDAAIQATHAAKILDRTLTGGDIQKAEALLEKADSVISKELRQANIALTMNLVEIYPNRVRLANAGMPAPLLFRRDQAQPQALQAAGVYVGGGYRRFPVEPRYAQASVSEGDLLVLVSDGVVEALDANSGIFGRSGIEAVVARQRDDAPGEIANAILAAASAHAQNAPPADDQTVVVVRFGVMSSAEVGARPVVTINLDESEAEFTLTNTINSAEAFHTQLQGQIRGWVERVEGYSSGVIWCAVWELLKNAVVHGSKRGEVISLKLRITKNKLEVEIEQPAEWRGWDVFLGDDRPERLAPPAEIRQESLDDHFGTAALLRLADTVTASMLGRRLTLVFAQQVDSKQHKVAI